MTQKEFKESLEYNDLEYKSKATEKGGEGVMDYMSAIVDWLEKFFLPTLAAASVLAAWGWVQRKKVKAWAVNKRYQLTNKTMIASVKSVYTYPVPESGPLDVEFSSSLCDEIASNTEYTVTEPDWGDNWAKFKVEGVPTDVKVRFEPQLNRSFHNPSPEAMESDEDISGYKLVVETEGDLYFGYKEMFPLINFKTFSEKLKEVIEAEYLPSETPDTTHIQVRLMEGVPEGIDEINDRNLNIQGRVRDDALDLTFRTPENLQQGLRKYFQASS